MAKQKSTPEQLAAKEEAQKGKTPNELWVELTEPRVSRALDGIRILGNVFSANYKGDYTEEQRDMVLNALREAMSELEDKAAGKVVGKSGFKLK